MTQIVSELYEALKAAGVEDDLARRAAESVLPREHHPPLVTMMDLRVELAELKAELIKWNVATLVAMTGIFAAIVKLL